VARLTEEVSRRWGGAATRCSGVRQRPRRREGRRQLRLALGPAGEDEGGDGGPKTENDGGLGGSHRGGGTVTAVFDSGKIGEGSGDFGIRGMWTESREDGRDIDVLELGREGAEWQRGAGRWPTLLNALDARQREKGGEGVGSVPRGGGRGAEREGLGCGAA
jgi:hypothetical protein